MNSAYWRHAFEIGTSVYRDRTIQDVDEQAGPAYFATSGLSRWLFWQRLKWAVQQIDKTPGQVALDFGCGFGLLLPHLRTRFASTVAVDLVPALAQDFIKRWDQQPTEQGGSLSIFSSLADSQLASGSVDLIIALDVLEHFESLSEIVDQLCTLLKPDGQLLVSGPTETWLYKLGRRLVGFSGDYHHQTIYDVHLALEPKSQLISVSRLPPVLPLFLLSRWQLRRTGLQARSLHTADRFNDQVR